MTVQITTVLEHNCRNLLFQEHDINHGFPNNQFLYSLNNILARESFKSIKQSK